MEIPVFKHMSKEECSGCNACYSCCPTQAIKMSANEEGFEYPILDNKKCCSCNKCVNVCPVINSKEQKEENKKVYGGYIKEKQELVKSASGGAFFSLAQKIIKDGGYVFGVVYSEDYMAAEYMFTNKIEEIEKMRGSKYIQSKKNDIFRRVQEILLTGEMVLFSGLPCEIAGLNSFLGKQYGNLITCELICHGPTSNKVNQQYIEKLTKWNKSKIREFTVRYKNKDNWTPPYIKAKFENGKEYITPFYSTEYGAAFSIMKRYSCYQCKFKGENTQADITIGDYWGLEKNDQRYNKSGVSVVIVHSSKGERLIDGIEGFKLFEGDYNEVVQNNLPLVRSTPMSQKRKSFGTLFSEGGLERASRKGVSIKERIYRLTPSWLYRLVPTKIIRVIKKIISNGR